MNRTSLVLLLVQLGRGFTAEVTPQARDTATADSAQRGALGVPVVFAGDTLFRLVARLGPFSPEDRAIAVEARLAQLIKDPLPHVDSVSLSDGGTATDLLAGDRVLMSVTNDDAAVLGLPRREAAQRLAGHLTRALRKQQEAMSFRQIAIGAAYAVGVTVILIVALMLLSRFYPRLYRTLQSWRGTRIKALRLQRLEVLSADRIVELAIGLAKISRIVIVLLLFYVYLPLVFSFFPWTRGVAGIFFGYILTPLGAAGRGFLAYLPNVFYIIVILGVTRYISKLVRWIFSEIERGTISIPGFYRDWAPSTYKIVRVLIFAFAAVLLFPYLPGSGSQAFQGISVFVGVLVSFGSGSAIANAVAGVVLTYMRPFVEGDRVRIADTVGDVTQKTILVTRVRTIKNVDVTVPNSMVLGSHIVNYSSSAKRPGLILHTTVTIGYDAPWRTVHELLIDAARATPGLLADPAPFVLQTTLDDFYVHYEINAFTDQPNGMAQTYSALHANIQEKFNEGGVEIMSAHYLSARDGNDTTIPESYRPKQYRAPAFRVRTVPERDAPGAPDAEM